MINNELYKEAIKEVTANPNRLAEKYILSNYSDLHRYINEYAVFYKIDTDTFKEKLWHYINNRTSKFLCISCNEKATTFNKKFADGYKKYCSAKCAGKDPNVLEKRKATVLDTYGVDNVAKNETVKKKIEDTNIKVYGTKSSFQSEEVKKKWRDNVKEKYGVDHIFQLDDVKDTITDTMMERYGKKRYTQTDKFKEKQVETNRNKFGADYYTQTDEYINKNTKTNIEKYGSELYILSDDFKNKRNKFLIDNNIESINQLPSKRKKASITSRAKIYDTYVDDFGIELTRIDEYNHKIYSKECGHESIMSISSFYQRRVNNEIICNTCNPFYKYKPEVYLHEFISKYVNSNNIIVNKMYGNKYQLDIFLPDYNIGIEHNGLYWHSEINKHSNYHQEKTDFFKSIGIDLIHVWEDDFINKRNIVESIILNRINKSIYRLYARKLIVKFIEDKSAVNEFLNNNHIQGTSSYSYAIGLYNDDELVSIMTFGMRNISKSMELVRFCNKLNYTIIGAADKIFKHFIKNMKIDSDIISYQDSAMFNGGLYSQLGFIEDSGGYVSYWWVLGGKRYNRQKFTKQKLVSDGYPSDKSAIDIMHSRGAYRVYGCKQKVWKYTIPK